MSCDTVQQKWKQADWAPQIHNQYFLSQALVSQWSHFLFQFIVYYYETPEHAENHPNAVDLAMDLLLSTQARKHRGEST